MDELDYQELKSNIELQITEIEMLQSMFPGDNEFKIDKLNYEASIKFCEGETHSLPLNLSYIIKLDLEIDQLEIEITLLKSYPTSSQPDIYIRSNKLNKHQHNSINQHLNGYLKSIEIGELCVGQLVTWLQDNAKGYFTPQENQASSLLELKSTKFVRMWIYSHHIYSKTKRKDMLDLSKQHNLTGFILPGKPGIICIEGDERNVDLWWIEVRKWTWQKILCKNREEEEDNGATDGNFRRFDNFEELGSDNDIRVKNGGYHVDMGDVFKYLERHESGYMFQEIFGFSGKI